MKRKATVNIGTNLHLPQLAASILVALLVLASIVTVPAWCDDSIFLDKTLSENIGVDRFQLTPKSLLVATDMGLYRFHSDGTGPVDKVKGFSDETFFKAFQPGAKALLVSTDKGLYRLTSDGSGEATKVTGSFLEPTVIQPMRETMLVGTNMGLFRLSADGSGNATKVDNFPWEYVYAIQVTTKDVLVGTSDGLYLLNAVGTGGATKVKSFSGDVSCFSTSIERTPDRR